MRRGVPKTWLKTITDQPQQAELPTLIRLPTVVWTPESISRIVPSIPAKYLKKYHRRSCVQQLWSPRHGGIINKITQNPPKINH